MHNHLSFSLSLNFAVIIRPPRQHLLRMRTRKMHFDALIRTRTTYRLCPLSGAFILQELHLYRIDCGIFLFHLLQRAAMADTRNVLILFDVDGTLTPSRLVRPSRVVFRRLITAAGVLPVLLRNYRILRLLISL